MAITVDELQAMAKSGDTERTSKLEGILKAINSSGYCHREFEGMRKAINSTGFFVPDMDGTLKAINSSSYFAAQLDGIAAQLDGIRKSLNDSFALAEVSSASLANLVPSAIDLRWSLRSAAKLMEPSYIGYSTLQSAINQLIQTDLHRYSSFRLSGMSELVHTLELFGRAQGAIVEFFATQVELSLRGLEPLRRYYAELVCDVNSVKVDIVHGSQKVLRAEYDRENAVNLLSTIILLKDLHKSRYEVQDGHMTSEELFNCSVEHDTHYAEYRGDVAIKADDEGESKSLTDWFQELKEGGKIDDERWEETRYLAYRAERFFRQNFGTFFYCGLLALAEASVYHVLNHPVSAEEHRELERMMGRPLRRLLPKPSPGGNTRGGDAWYRVPPRQFAKRVDELYDTAASLLNGYNQYKPNYSWLEILKLTDSFKPFLRTCKECILDQVALLIPVRLKESRSKNRRHESTPLAFACELAARELNIRKRDGSFYRVEYLIKKYREGGKPRLNPTAREGRA